MNLLTLCNKQISKYYNEHKKPLNYKPLLSNFHDLFKKHGEGLYLVNVKAASSNFVSNIIGKLSGGYSHSFIFLYSEDLKSRFTKLYWAKITENWNKNYNNLIPLNENIKTLVISSADSTGMECFDFSQYELRKITIRKIPATKTQENIILSFLVNIIGRTYDYTGLFFWLLGIGNDSYSYYCSENVYNACKTAKIQVAEKDNPSPGQIEAYESIKKWLIYSNAR
jgi:hypothetical protein